MTPPTLYGDGVHDDAPALQALIDAGKALPSGVFRLSRALVIPPRPPQDAAA